MTGHRGRLVAALVASVVLLLGSMTAVAVYAASHTSNVASGQAGGRPGDGRGWGATDGMGGMMGDGEDGWMGGDGWTVSGGTGAAVTADQARALAQAWVDANTPGATLDAASTMSGAYRFTVTRDGQTVALVWVEAATGRLGAQTLPAPTPSPA